MKELVDRFALKCYLVLISADVTNGKQYILSNKKNILEIPNIYIKEDSIAKVEDYLVSYMKSLIFVSDLELIPQIININNTSINQTKGEINIVYGFVVGLTNSINTPEVYWYEFDYQTHTKYSELIAEVIRKLK